jgi:hypothetical protein
VNPVKVCFKLVYFNFYLLGQYIWTNWRRGNKVPTVTGSGWFVHEMVWKTFYWILSSQSQTMWSTSLTHTGQQGLHREAGKICTWHLHNLATWKRNLV